MRSSRAPLTVCLSITALIAVPTAFTLIGPRTVPASTTPILEFHGDSYRDYLPTSASTVQDILPTHVNRGTNLEGSLRYAPAFPMAIAGNPFEDAWHVDSIGGVRLDSGAYQIDDVDLALPAEGFRWVIGRTYNALQETSGGSHHDSDGYQGRNWFQSSQLEIVFYDDATDAADDVVCLIYGADRYVEYKRDSTSSDTFKGVNGAAGVIMEQIATDPATDPDLYTLYDQHGTQWDFFGFDSDADPAKGQIWKITDPAGNAAYVGDSTTASTAITSGFTAEGYISKAYDTSDRRYTYSYTTIDGTKRLTEVKAETKTGGTWSGTPTGVEEVASVAYDYYDDWDSTADPEDKYGTEGDLRCVEITTDMSDSGVELRRRKYYRYWEANTATPNPEYDHYLKYVLGFEGARGEDWDADTDIDTLDPDSSLFPNYYTDADTTIDDYADVYFEYDSNRLIDVATLSGECGCAGGTNGTYNLTYDTDTGFSDTSGTYDEEWYGRAVVDRPDGTFLTQYFDEIWQPLAQVISSTDPTENNYDTWITGVIRDTRGCVSDVRSPASATGYTHDTGGNPDGTITHSSTVGLVHVFGRETSGTSPVQGFVKNRFWKVGIGGGQSEYFDGTWTWSVSAELTPTGAEEEVVRPLVASFREYTEEITTGTSGSNLTSYGYDEFHSGDAALMPKKVTTTYPAVATSNNGSGSSTTRKQAFDADGSMWLDLARDGIVTYFEYTDGQLSKRIDDADTAHTDLSSRTIPNGMSSTGTENHWTTSITYAGSSIDESTSASGAVSKSYFSKLADERIVRLTYVDYRTSPTEYWGPIEYQVLNHLGKPVVESVVGLSGDKTTTAIGSHIDETKSDPIAAIGIGTLDSMTTSVYSNAGGKLTERRVYTDIPTSGAGSSGTNYDATLVGYDDMGRITRIERPSGTIHRTVYDDMGKVEARHIGTDDTTWPGGDTGGTENMEQTEALQYDDNADDGNGYLTKRILYAEDNAGGARTTTLENDEHGRVELETRPETPHYLYAYDNLGRKTAIGLYKGTGSVSAGDDPTTTTSTDRIGLVEVEYDERGDLWKFIRHEITQSTGAKGSTLEEQSWYDEARREIQFEGNQIVKWTHDRFGRRTHEFLLAEVTDSDYDDAKAVDSDIVVEERQTVYGDAVGRDSQTDEQDERYVVAMEILIQRYEDDFGAGETTGELDTNVDSDPRKLTASNLKGRAQVTAFWYDDQGRVEEEVVYGTNDGSDFDRDSETPPTSRSGDQLQWTYVYADGGELEKITDPRDLDTYFEYDDAGQRTKAVRNYTGGSPTAPDDDQTVEYAYDAGRLSTLTVKMPGVDKDQVTTYLWECSGGGGGTGGSEIYTNDALAEVKYPDEASEAKLTVTYAYNAQGELIWQEKQADGTDSPTQFTWSYDDEGRETKWTVNQAGTGFDATVDEIRTGYEDRGLIETVGQYDTSQVIIDEVKFTYDGWGNLTEFEQDHDSAVATSGGNEYSVSYEYERAVAGRNTVRRDEMTLPSGNVITYQFTNGYDDGLSRVSKIKDGAVVLCRYDYLGAERVVGTTYQQSEVYSKLYGSTSGSYPNLDKFNRVTTSSWTSDVTGTPEFYSVDIEYDANSNPLWIEDNVHVGFDVRYEIDDLDRVKRAEEGTRSGSSITSQARDQTWTLDLMGNWDRVSLDFDDDDLYGGTNEYDDDRDHNKANELIERDTDAVGTAEHDLVYDAEGNLTDDDDAYEYEYDCFGRLVGIEDQNSNQVAEYLYNGLGYLIQVHEDWDAVGGLTSGDPWFHIVYDDDWRVVAWYRDADSDPKEEFINHQAGFDGLGYASLMNDVILRDRDASDDWWDAADGTLEQRAYYCQNWRGDVSALVRSNRKIIEWAKYSAYGIPIGLPGGDANSDGDCQDASPSDLSQIQAWIDTSSYDARGDVDLDGDVDSTDKSSVAASYLGASLGWNSLSEVGNRKGHAGRMDDRLLSGVAHLRNRSYDPGLGRWNERDPAGYGPGSNLYELVVGSPLKFIDPLGLQGEGLNPYSSVGPIKDVYIEQNPTPNGYNGTVVVKTAAVGAYRAARQYKENEGGNTTTGPANAMLHCVWLCRICQNAGGGEAGGNWALGLGLAHEMDNPGSDTNQDLHNNHVGVECCIGGSDCWTCCDWELHNGGLRWGDEEFVFVSSSHRRIIRGDGSTSPFSPLDPTLVHDPWRHAEPPIGQPLPGEEGSIWGRNPDSPNGSSIVLEQR